MAASRSIFAQKLKAFPQTVLADDAATGRRGEWRDRLRRCIGAGFDGHIVFEIGCFDASFLARIAAQHPRSAFVGIDWKYRQLFLGAQSIADKCLPNITLLRGRAQDILQFFAPGEVDEIWVFHPDPCDRPVELKNRLFAEPFLIDAHTALRDGSSTLTLKTDHPGYYQWVLGLLGQPQPPWFAAAREAHACRVPPPISIPRVRARDLVDDAQIPAPSHEVLARFGLSIHSPDFWNDPAARSQTAGRLFARETTAFEHRFIKKRMPIYYVEMTKIAR